MLDVAATFEALCACRAFRRSLEHAAERTLNGCDIARLSGLAYLHDLGKANAGFQAKRWLDSKRPHWIKENGHSCEWLTAGHGIEAIALIDAALSNDEALALLSRLPLKAMAGWGSDETLGNLLGASIAHHGRPLSQTTDWFNVRTHWCVHGDYDPGAQLDRIAAALQEFVPEAFSAGGLALPVSPRFAHVFAGLVQLADWLASDTYYFPYSQPGENRLQSSRGLARKAVMALGLDAEDARRRLLELAPDFAAVFDGNAPYPTQAAMADDKLGSVVVLEAETGSGKTEAALWRFLHLFKKGEVDSLYFALPTRVAAARAH